MPDGTAVDYDGLIPNNVGLDDDLRVRKALETWHPGYIDWWKADGPGRVPGQPGLSAHRRRRRLRRLGQVRLRADAGIPLGRPAGAGRSRAAQSRSARTRASPPGRRCPANIAPCCAACW